MLEEKPGEDGLKLDNAVPASLAVEADRDQLFRVLQNLARNAAEAGARRIEFRGRAEGDALRLEVADDGPGLPPKARENLFRPFAGSARPGGTGLGLAIAREVMRAHGGDIALQDSTGSGTVFVLTLPSAPPVKSVPQRRTRKAQARSRAAALIERQDLRLEIGALRQTPDGPGWSGAAPEVRMMRPLRSASSRPRRTASAKASGVTLCEHDARNRRPPLATRAAASRASLR